jgi:hypothetical protein
LFGQITHRKTNEQIEQGCRTIGSKSVFANGGDFYFSVETAILATEERAAYFDWRGGKFSWCDDFGQKKRKNC